MDLLAGIDALRLGETDIHVFSESSSDEHWFHSTQFRILIGELASNRSCTKLRLVLIHYSFNILFDAFVLSFLTLQFLVYLEFLKTW